MPSTEAVHIFPVLRLRPTSPALQQLIANAVRESERPAIDAPARVEAPATARPEGLDTRA